MPALPHNPQRIVVRLTNWIGDALMNTPALAALRRLYPQAEIDVLGRPYVLPLFEHNPDVNALLPYPQVKGLGKLRQFTQTAALLRARRYDLGIVLQNAFEGAALLAAGGVRYRVGYARDGRRPLLSLPVPCTEQDLAMHETRYYLKLVRALGSQETEPQPYRLVLSAAEQEQAATLLREAGIAPGEPILAVNPGATYGSAKRWYPERYAAVADGVAEQLGWRVFVVGTAAELPMATAIAEQMRHAPTVLSGKTSLRELAGVLSSCRLLLTNDSGTMHVGCAMGLPCVAVVGSTNPVTTHPWAVPYRIVREPVECSPCLLRECPIDHRCMDRVSVARVLAAVLELAGAG